MASVSVCIVTYNSEAYITDCLKAVCRQSYPIASIIVVDNASYDRSVQIVERFDSGNIAVHLLHNPINNGFAGGQNQAIGASDSDYVLVLNPDVRLDEGYVQALVELMERDKRIGSATGQLLFAHDPTIIDSTGLTFDYVRQAKDRGAGEPASNWQTGSEVFGVSGAASMYARRMIRDVSINGEFFDEHFFAYKEDVDVAWRARRFGWTSYYEPKAKALHARGWKKGGRGNTPLFVRQHSYMNRFYTLIKNEPLGWHSIWRIPAIVAVELAKLSYLMLKEAQVLKCVPTLFRSIPGMYRKRKVISKRFRERSTSNGTRMM